MSCVAQQREAVLPNTHASFYAHKKEIQYNGHPQDFAHLSIIDSHMVITGMVLVVMMMFLTHCYWFLIGMDSAQKQIHAEISNNHT